jgi:hypothetical protein
MAISAVRADVSAPAGAAALESFTAASRDLAARSALGRRFDPHDPAVVKRTASQLVSETVFVPLLAEMREFPFGNEIGSGGRGEAVFAEQLDQRIADTVAASSGGLADQIARRLQGNWLAHEQARQTAEGSVNDA